MKIDVDYKITEYQFGYRSEDDLFGVELLTGEFKDIKYTYGTLKFADQENEDGSFAISFDYKIREGEVQDNDVEKFENVISDVLHSVLIHSLNNAEEQYKNETRNTNTEALDIE